jgi:hypothetical protein
LQLLDTESFKETFVPQPSPESHFQFQEVDPVLMGCHTRLICVRTEGRADPLWRAYRLVCRIHATVTGPPEQANFSPQTLGGGSVRIILTVADPDAVFARAVAAGASQVYPVGEEYGWRLGRVVGPFGHHWEIRSPLA